MTSGKPLVWLQAEVKTPPFSHAARIEAGTLLRRLQNGEQLEMPISRPMPDVGTRCHELRVDDGDVAVKEPRWIRNDFMDHIHAGMFGYVDFFVTRDGLGKKPGLIQKVKWFDSNVRALHGVAPYGDRLRAGFSDFAERLP